MDHTLIKDGQVEKKVMSQMLKEAAPDDAAIQAQVDGVLDRMRPGPEPVSEALPRELAALKQQFPKLQFDPKKFALEFQKRAVAMLPLTLTVMPGAPQLLEACKKLGYGTAIVTNGWPELQQEKARLLGYDGPLFTSDGMRLWKPNPLAFAAALQAVHAPAAAAVYVGDNPRTDVDGSKAAGMTSVWLNEKGAPVGDHKPDIVVPDLGTLQKVIENGWKTPG